MEAPPETPHPACTRTREPRDPRIRRVHDATSKTLYSLPETIEALALAVAPHMADEMDFTRLARLSTEYAATDQRPRYGDMLWEFHLRDGTPVLIVVEFQSDVDHTMPQRLFQYTGSALLEWTRIRQMKAGDPIPILLPVLIYGGRGRWTPPIRLEELQPPDADRVATQPRFEYNLVEERRGGTERIPEDNLVGQLLAVGRARGRREMVSAVSRLQERMEGPGEGGALDRAVAAWIRSIVTDLDPALGHELRAAKTTREVMEVIKPKEKWAIRWYEDGLDEGHAEGHAKGRAEGRAEAIEQGIRQQQRLVRGLVARRFGADAADRVAAKLDQLSDPERISAVADAVLDCETAEEFIARTVVGPTRPS